MTMQNILHILNALESYLTYYCSVFVEFEVDEMFMGYNYLMTERSNSIELNGYKSV